MNCFNLITANLKVEDFIRINSSLLDKAVTAYNNEELPLGVVPVLTFSNSWFADIDAYLPSVKSVD